MKLNRILVATDFSEASEGAIEAAFKLGSESGARLYLLHVLELPTGVDPVIGLLKPPMTEARKKAIQELDRIAACQRHRDIEVEEVVLVGPIAQTIGDFARKKDVDMIVVGSHGRTGLARVLLGSTAEALLRQATCQVLAVKQPARGRVSEAAE